MIASTIAVTASTIAASKAIPALVKATKAGLIVISVLHTIDRLKQQHRSEN